MSLETLLLYIEKFLSNPIVWGVMALLAIALALSGRVSMTAATWLVWIAWIMAIFGAYRAVAYFGLDIILRLLIVGALSFTFAIGAVLLNRWFCAPNLNSKSQPALPRLEAAKPSDVGKSTPASRSPSPERGAVVAPLTSPESGPDPIGHLIQLGWNVKHDTGNIQFEIASRPLPDMKKSAAYFRVLRRPFRLQFQQVPSIAGISSLAGINDCVEIGISASDITDLSELSFLKSLRKLNISQTPFTVRTDLDISPLASLVNLETLGLNMARVNDIEPLRGLTKLVSLNIGGSLVRDLSPIKGLTLLKSIDVRDSRVADMSVLDGDDALEEVSVDEKQVPSLTHLSRLPKLNRLNIIAQVPVDMAAVGTLSNLTFLFIWGPPVIDLSPLRKLGKLTNLQVSGLGFNAGLSRVIDADAIGELPQLKTLTLGQVQIDSLRFITRLNNLAELNVSRIPIGSVAELANLVSLKQISLVDVPVVDISPLLWLPNLAKVYLMRTPARADVIAQLERRGVKVSNP
jgi:internalin A